MIGVENEEALTSDKAGRAVKKFLLLKSDIVTWL